MARGYRASDSKRYYDWLYYAAIDLHVAQKLTSDKHCYNTIAFHCQQAIEKAMKGYLLWKRNRLYDGHNLPFLCKQCMQDDRSFSKWLPSCVQITRYYIEARYPADFLLQLDATTADAATKDTEQILDDINALVKFDFNSYRPKQTKKDETNA
ncbi:MAG: HEPN domain-containing protein [Oscillospiraceae bacterium]|nr:HEPN domain-containing protein [Oscillospiraceae bacterium]